MANDIQIRDGNEDLTTIATEDIGGREFQLIKVGYGDVGSFSNISQTHALPVSGTIGLNINQPLTNTELRTSAIDVNVITFPETIGISASQELSVTFTQVVSANILNQKDVQEVSGTVNTNIIFPEILSIQGTVGVSSIPVISATILNFQETSATDLQYNGTKVTNSNPLPVSGNFSVIFPETQNVSGSVSINGVVGISGTPLVSASIINFPKIQEISGNISVQMSATDIQYNGTKVTNSNPLPVSGNFDIAFPATQNINGVVGVSSVPNISATILNFPTIQTIQGTVGVSGSHGVSGTVSATITNFPSSQTINGLVGISAAISANILNYPSTQNIVGIVGISGTPLVSASVINFPKVQEVSGNISSTITNLPSVQNVSGNISASITNFPSTQTVQGSIDINSIPVISANILNQKDVQEVSGTITVITSSTDLQVDGSLVTSANPLPIIGDVNTTEKANLINYWPNMESIETEKVELNVDPSGALQIRGAVTTDEGSYSTDFGGTTIYEVLSGTCIFQNGSTVVSGIGTSFLKQIEYGDFVKLDSDNIAYYTRVISIVSNTEIELEYGYPGSTNNGTGYNSGFETIVEGSGVLSVLNSKLILDSGLSANSMIQVSRVVDFLPTAAVLRNFSFSQNSPQSDCYFGFFDSDDYRNSKVACYVIFTEFKSAKLVTRTSLNSYDTNEVAFTLPGNSYIYTPARWKLEITDDKVSVFYNEVSIAVSLNHLPPIYKPLNFNIGVFNKQIPDSTTTVYLDEVLFKNVDVVNTTSVLQSHIQMSYDVEANTTLKELTSTMNSLQSTLKSFASIMGMAVDTNGRQRTNVETGSITASIAAAQTLATVTTVGTVTTVTGQTNLGTYAANDMVPANINNSAFFLRQGIIVT